MADEPADDTFVFSLPVWILAAADTVLPVGLPLAVKVMKSDKHGNLLGLFTDEDLAKRFIEEEGMPNTAACKVSLKSEFLNLLYRFQHGGVKYVGIDCPTRANPRREAGRFPRLEDVIAAAIGLPDDALGSNDPA
jgi:hypothetical protein